MSEWGEKLADPKTHPQSLTSWLKGDSFEAEARLEQDYDQADDIRCISIRLKRVSRGPQLEKFIYIRHATARRRLDHPRTWRRLGGLPEKKRKHRRQTLAGRAREIYWHPSTVDIDLRVQLVIALIQSNLLRDSQLDTELPDYIKAFRKRVSKDIAHDAATEVLKNWSFPEDHRAFRKYVGKQLNLTLRRNMSQGGDEPCEEIRPEEIHHAIREAESRFEVLRNPDCEDVGNSASPVHLSIPAGDFWKVHDASLVLGVTPRYIYKLIQTGSLQSGRRNGVVVVPTSEIRRLRALFEQRKFNQTQRQELVSRGIKSEAARKRIYRARKRGSLETRN